MPKPRVGHIDFLNVSPLGYAYRHGEADGIKVVRDVPKVLNDAMRAGELDASNVSSILYAKEADRFVILPDVCVSTDGAVKSILLISLVPLEEVGAGPVALTKKSETSHALVKLIFRRKYGRSPIYREEKLSVHHPVPEDAAASLFIGDDALWLYYHRDPALHYYDVGALYREISGEKMVYGLFVASRSFAENDPVGLQRAYDAIRGGLAYGLAHREAVIREAIEKTEKRHALTPDTPDGFTADELDDYLGPTIRWDLTEPYVHGLATFYRLAYEEGLIPALPPLRFADVKRADGTLMT